MSRRYYGIPNPSLYVKQPRRKGPPHPSNPPDPPPKPTDNRTLWEMMCGVKIGESKYDKRRYKTSINSHRPPGRG